MEALAREKAAEIGRLAAEAARSLGCGDAGLEAAEAVIRTGMLRAGCGVLEQLLAADPGYRGPRVPCGQGHAVRDQAVQLRLIQPQPHERVRGGRQLLQVPRPLADHRDRLLPRVGVPACRAE